MHKKLAMIEEIIFGNLYDTQNKTESVVIVSEGVDGMGLSSTGEDRE